MLLELTSIAEAGKYVTRSTGFPSSSLSDLMRSRDVFASTSFLSRSALRRRNCQAKVSARPVQAWSEP